MLISGLLSIVQLLDLPADGIYIGLENISWRCGKYFSYEEVNDIMTIARKKHILVYICFNRMYVDVDLQGVMEALEWCKAIGVDGILYSSLAVWQLAKAINWTQALIYQSDTLITNTHELAFFLPHNQYIMIGKEIPLQEVYLIAKQAKQQVGLVVHGHLNMSYSRRPLLSNYLEQVNKTFDETAKYYLQEETRDSKMLIIQETMGTSIYTSWLLESLEELSQLNKNIDYLWIEAIGLNCEQLTKTVQVYRDVINDLLTPNQAVSQLPQIKDHSYSKGYHYLQTKKTKAELNDE